MTRSRQHAFGIGFVLLGALALTVAEPAQAAEDVSAAPKPPAAKAWLRGDKPAAAKPTAPAGPSNARMALVSAVIAILAGAAYVVKRRRRVVVRGVPSELTVVTAARVGSKADVVIVSVAGRRLLLGVTEAQVSRLCWLDGDPESEEASDFELPPALIPASAPVPSQRMAVPVRPTAPRGFRETLLGALGRAPAAPDPAVLIAAATEDVVTRFNGARVAAPAGAPEMVDVEGQARGLVLRLQKRV